MLWLRFAAATAVRVRWLTGDIEEDRCGISGGDSGILRIGACRHEAVVRDSLQLDLVVPRFQCVHPDRVLVGECYALTAVDRDQVTVLVEVGSSRILPDEEGAIDRSRTLVVAA